MILQPLSSSEADKAKAFAIKELVSGFSEEFEKYLKEAVETTRKQTLHFESIGPNTVHKKIVITGSNYDYGYLLGLIWKKKFGDLQNAFSKKNYRLNHRQRQ